MNTAEEIYIQVKSLPDPIQKEVLDFVEYLSLKLRREDLQWGDLSLKTALQGLEDDQWPEYGRTDFKERWL